MWRPAVTAGQRGDQKNAHDNEVLDRHIQSQRGDRFWCGQCGVLAGPSPTPAVQLQLNFDIL